MERSAKEGESPVREKQQPLETYPSTAGHEESCRNLGGPSPKAKYGYGPIVNQYREGKVKRTLRKGVK